MPSVTVIIPTYREAANMRELLARLARVRCESLPELDVIIVDDDSGDGIDKTVEDAKSPWVRLLVRRNERGLSTAVMTGMREARGEVLAVMDADLSHPPEKLPELVERLGTDGTGADLVMGSRYARGGTTDARWTAYRWLNSKVATLMARPLTRVRDPMSGFFVLRRETFERAAPLNPLGYKIGLELMVKGRCRRVDEVPIHFSERTRGESKLTLKQQWLYVRHVGRLILFRLRDRAAS